jgi:DNA polymerase
LTKPSQPLSLSEKKALLQDIQQALENLEESPLYAYRQKNHYQPVVGEGSLDASILFIGEAPGAKEAQTGQPFVGSAGKVLNEMLEKMGLNREDVYITNIVKDRPPDNRDPRSEEIDLYAPFLSQQINLIRPKVIATLGRFAMDFILEKFDHSDHGKKIGELHGRILTVEAAYGSISMLPLYHPAATFYNRSLRPEFEADFQKLTAFI